MEQINQPILFVFIKDLNFLYTNDFFIKIGSITTSNDQEKWKSLDMSDNFGYIYHWNKAPFILFKKQPRILTNYKANQVVFRIYEDLNELASRIRISQNTKKFFKNYFFSNNSHYAKRIVNDIFPTIRFSQKFAYRHVEKNRIKKNDESINILDIEDLILDEKEIKTYRQLYQQIFQNPELPILNVKEIMRVLNDGILSDKESIDRTLDELIAQKQLGIITSFNWSIRFNKIILPKE
jgi:hypothetical protein